jgi:sulfoxide reductase heme-binding subunit YedZ
MVRRCDPAKAALFLLCLVPLAVLAARAGLGQLGANPIEAINRALGDWALRFLLISLAVTPLRQLGWRGAARLRRMLGLYAFFYAAAHVTSYVVLDNFFDWPAIAADILKRRYITVGMLALMLLLPLAATSTDAMIRRLGGRRWRRLHRLVYAAAMLAVLHYAWMVKADLREPILYGALLAVLLLWRLVTAVGVLRGRAASVGPG